MSSGDLQIVTTCQKSNKTKSCKETPMRLALGILQQLPRAGWWWRRSGRCTMSILPHHPSPLHSVPSLALHIFVSAGEPSGDMLAAATMRELKARSTEEIHFSGIGGDNMKEAGLCPIFDMSELSVMGIFELIPHLPRLWKRLREAVSAAEAARPDIVLTVDSKGFNNRLIKTLKKSETMADATFVHLVGPSVWAYKGDHTKTKEFLKSHLDLLLVLFPFEQAHFEKYLPVTCIGPHIFESPAVRRLLNASTSASASPASSKDDRSLCPPDQHQTAHGARLERTKTVLLLPGSRPQEVRRHLPLLLEAASALSVSHPSLSFSLITVPSVAPLVHSALPPSSSSSPPISLLTPSSALDRLVAMRGASLAIAVSGSVTLELAACMVPSVVVYKAHLLTELLARRLAAVSFVALPNLLLAPPPPPPSPAAASDASGAAENGGSAPVHGLPVCFPELLFSACSTPNVVAAASALLRRPPDVTATVLAALYNAAPRPEVRESASASEPKTDTLRSRSSSSDSERREVEPPSAVAARAILQAHARKQATRQ